MNDLDELRLSRDNAVEFSRQMVAQNTDLRTRLAASEAEKSLAVGALAICREQRDATEDALRTAYQDVDAWKEAEFRTQARLREERSKREEAERALADVRSGMIGLAEVIAAVPGVFPCLNALLDLVRAIPVPHPPEKKSQEKP